MNAGNAIIAGAVESAKGGISCSMSLFRLDADGTGRVLGEWTTVPLGGVEPLAQKARKSSALKTLDLSGLTRLDTNGAFALLRFAEQTDADGLIPLENAKTEHDQLLDVEIKAIFRDKPPTVDWQLLVEMPHASASLDTAVSV